MRGAPSNMRRYFLTLGFLVLIGGGIAYSEMSRSQANGTQRDPLAGEHEWRDEIRKSGAEFAYETLAQSVAAESVHTQHSAAHAFGAALFAEEGADGLPVCDSRFSFGCFHEFLGVAIPALGIESVSMLNDACYDDLSESPLSCQHGIGHGVLSTYGYDNRALLQSLEVCRGLKRGDPIGGCYGGVFMEYNVRTMLGEQATPRKFAGNPFDSCESLDGVFVPACLYWVPQWWLQEIFGPGSANARMEKHEVYAAMGSYCRDFAHTDELTRACFEGLGNVVADYADFESETARTLCEAAGTRPAEDLLCLAIGANHFGINSGAEVALQMCIGLEGDALTYCTAYARNEANIALVRPLPL